MKYFISICIFILFSKTFINAQVNIAENKAAYQSSAANYNNTAQLAADGDLTTYWQTKSAGNEWIYIDLGDICDISNIIIHWGDNQNIMYNVQISTEGADINPMNWKSIYDNTSNSNTSNVSKKCKARYVKLNLKSNSSKGFILNEIQVFGITKKKAKQRNQSYLTNDGIYLLTDGNWKLQKEERVQSSGLIVSSSAFDDKTWVDATVPGTVLTSYLNNGAIPDPFYSNQQLFISESFFYSNFWYRNKFSIPASYKDKKVWLNFDGINWKADIYLNGKEIGKINGAFMRGKYDVTNLVNFDKENIIAVLIHKNNNPGGVTEQHLNDPDGNGGIIGLDSPTFLASIGWNWLPTIRGRNIGIWNDVYLSSTNSVVINNPYIITDFDLPDTTYSNVSLQLTLKNTENREINGELVGEFTNVSFHYAVKLNPLETKTITLDKNNFPQLVVEKPKLWWPNGYGAQNLDTLSVKFISDNNISDSKKISFGFRKFSYVYDNNLLRIHVNGQPIFIRGGNWGMSEGLLRCDNEGYDLRVRLHKEMNLNMIRNWIGMIGDEEFYNACDKYGILVWDDFWLANPVDGPHPTDNVMFMENVEDKILLRRNHASLALWCGRNEGFPPAILDSAMNTTVNKLDNSRHYISSSADRPVTGLGPYETKDPNWYFKNRGNSLHSEQGIVCFPTYESLQKMMPKQYLWPINDMWGVHDWTQQRVAIFTNDLNSNYGKPNSASEFCVKAQFLNTEGPKAMMETWQSNRGAGVLVWMTHPAWPSLICQTYDYYFEPSAAYFAFKKGCEPIHVLWRSDKNIVQVANNTLHHLESMMVITYLYKLNGELVYTDSTSCSINKNSVIDIKPIKYPQSNNDLYFIKLELRDMNRNLLSDNFYWTNTAKYQDYNKLSLMNKVNLNASAKIVKNKKTIINVDINNVNKDVALMVRLKVVNKKTGDRVLPIFYNDNYFSLVQNEKKTINIELVNDIKANDIQIVVEGFNIEKNIIDIVN